MPVKRYPQWVDDFAQARYRSEVDSSPLSWGPIDSFVLPKFYEDAFANKLYQAIGILEQKKVSKEIVARSFSTVSALRTGISFLTADYAWTRKKDKEKFRKIFDYLLDLLKIRVPKDIFSLNSNLAHSTAEVEQILQEVQWGEANKEVAQLIGRLNVSLASLVFALFGDLYPQDSNETYGPYYLAGHETLIIRQFPEIKPVELWSNTKDFKYSNVKVYLIYQRIQFRTSFIGMHLVSSGDVISGLKRYAIQIDDRWFNSEKEIKNLTEYFAQIAVEQSQILEKTDFEHLKIKALEWVGYKYKGMFELAGMDWRPGQDLLAKIKGVKVATHWESKKIPTWKEYSCSKHNDYHALKDLYS